MRISDWSSDVCSSDLCSRASPLISFTRPAFRFDHKCDAYVCPGGKDLQRYNRNFATARSGVDQDGFLRYRASKRDCDACALKQNCCPGQPARKIPRSIHEGAQIGSAHVCTTVTNSHL